ncbi:hypothetical protein [Sulfitobacter sp. 1A15299]|uniref:hypothetical protein n=1 Tax=Sulfitobacter sp. 1A15299 TaxID=3368598 RepID=UPI003745D3AD
MLFLCLAVVTQALWLRAGRLGPSPKIWSTLIAVLLSILIIALEFRGALILTFVAAVLTGAYAISLNRFAKEV